MSKPELPPAWELGSAVIESMPIIVLLLSHEGMIDYANPFFEELTGRSLEEFRGKEWFSSFLPEHDRERIRELFYSNIEGAPARGSINPILSATGEEIFVEWHELRMREDGRGRLCIGMDVTEARRAGEKLYHAERLSKQVIDQIHDSVISIDLRGCVTSWNKGAETMFGSSSKEMMGKHISTVYPLDEQQFLDSDVIAPVLRNGKHHVEMRMLRASGEIFHGHLSLSILTEGDEPRGLIGYIMDITQRVLAEKRQELLVSELDHRVKNVLAVVRSLAAETANRSTSLEQHNETFLGRLDAMVSAHEALASNRWSGLPLGQAISDVLSNYLYGEKPPVEIRGPMVILPPQSANPFYLALHELATNASKHGVLKAGATGKVSLHWRREGPHLKVTWQERGGEPPASPITPGLGLTLVRGLIELEIGGHLALDVNQEGLVAMFSLPLGADAGEAQSET